MVRPARRPKGMSLKTIIATLILGTSSVALAHPAIRDHRASVSVQVSGGFGFGGYQQPSYEQPRPTFERNHLPSRRAEIHSAPELIAPPSLMSLSNDGYAMTGVDTRTSYSSLVFDGLGGNMTIDRLELKLTDGTIRTIRVGARLDDRRQSVTVDLGRRENIGFMTIYGSSPTRTSLQVSGMRF